LFDDDAALRRAVDGIRERHGYDAVHVALSVARSRR
jgi:hypothetical protein